MQMNVNIVVGALGLAVSVGTFFLGRISSARTSGKEYGVMLTEIGYIKSGVDDMKKKMERFESRSLELAERVTALEARVHIGYGEVYSERH